MWSFSGSSTHSQNCSFAAEPAPAAPEWSFSCQNQRALGVSVTESFRMVRVSGCT